MKNTDRYYDGAAQLEAALTDARNHCPHHDLCHEENIGKNGQCIYYNFDKALGKNRPDCLYCVTRRKKRKP